MMKQRTQSAIGLNNQGDAARASQTEQSIEYKDESAIAISWLPVQPGPDGRRLSEPPVS
jgi:hypothetical protein